MKNNEINVDTLLKRAMSRTEAPDEWLMQKLKQYKEEPAMRSRTIKRSFTVAAAAVLAMVLVTATAFAAWYLLKPEDVTGRLENTALTAAFSGDSAININQTVTSGDYTFTLLAVVSGKDISDNSTFINGQLHSDRTYAITAIQNADGSPMPDTSDDDYGNPDFYVSPYIKGEKPWLINAHTLNGGHTEMVVDGVQYRILECDEIAMFADRGVYLGINTGSVGNVSQAFTFDESSGELKVNSEYEGSNVLFVLPLDTSLADPIRAQEYLDTLWDD